MEIIFTVYAIKFTLCIVNLLICGFLAWCVLRKHKPIYAKHRIIYKEADNGNAVHLLSEQNERL